MKFIDAEKLREKIYAEDTVSLAHGSLPEFDQGCHYAFLTILSFIDSLQQEMPEVDFETEYAKFTNDPDELEYAFPIDLADYKDFALHFYELGLKARKV